MSRCQFGRDVRTPCELHAGKPFRRKMVERGERVHFTPVRPGGGARQEELDPKCQDGPFIDIRDRIDEMLMARTTLIEGPVGMSDGVMTSRKTSDI